MVTKYKKEIKNKLLVNFNLHYFCSVRIILVLFLNLYLFRLFTHPKVNIIIFSFILNSLNIHQNPSISYLMKQYFFYFLFIYLFTFNWWNNNFLPRFYHVFTTFFLTCFLVCLIDWLSSKFQILRSIFRTLLLLRSSWNFACACLCDDNTIFKHFENFKLLNYSTIKTFLFFKA